MGSDFCFCSLTDEPKSAEISCYQGLVYGDREIENRLVVWNLNSLRYGIRNNEQQIIEGFHEKEVFAAREKNGIYLPRDRYLQEEAEKKVAFA